MAESQRIGSPGAWYRVTSGGSERKELFRDDNDRRRFLETLDEILTREFTRMSEDKQLSKKMGGIRQKLFSQ